MTAARDDSANCDPYEIAKFAHTEAWWDPAGPLRTLHAINPLRVAYIAQRVSLAGKRVLDVGCGGGILAEALAQQGAHVTGIDRAAEALMAARRHAAQSGVTVDYREVAVETVANESPATFDVVTCLEMLEHVPQPEAIVNAVATVLKPSGVAFFSTLNRTPKAYLFAVLGAEYLLRLLPIGTHDYRRFIRPSELEAACRQAGLVMQELIGLHYHPLTRQYHLGSGVDVNYLAWCHKM